MIRAVSIIISFPNALRTCCPFFGTSLAVAFYINFVNDDTSLNRILYFFFLFFFFDRRPRWCFNFFKRKPSSALANAKWYREQRNDRIYPTFSPVVRYYRFNLNWVFLPATGSIVFVIGLTRRIQQRDAIDGNSPRYCDIRVPDSDTIVRVVDEAVSGLIVVHKYGIFIVLPFSRIYAVENYRTRAPVVMNVRFFLNRNFIFEIKYTATRESVFFYFRP